MAKRIGPRMQEIADYVSAVPGCTKSDALRAAGLDPEPGRAPADRPPPAQPRRTPGHAQAMTGTPRPRPAAAAAPAGQPRQRLERK